MPLLGAGLLGGGLGISGIAYLLRDLFTTGLAAGAVNGTAAEPGPGTRSVSDAQSKISISDDRLICSGGNAAPSWGAPAYALDAVGRVAGRTLHAHITSKNSSTGACIGWGVNAHVLPTQHALYHYIGTIWYLYEGGNITTLGTYTPNQGMRYAIQLRASGAYYFVKGGRYPTWTLIWWTSIKNAATVIPVLINNNTAYEADYIKVVDHNWLPSPLVSDGFGGAFGTSDGAAHAEASGIGSGGGDKTISATVGTWQTSGGVANASALSGGIGIATTVTSSSNVMVTVKMNRAGGSVGVVIRYVDADNYALVRHDGSSLKLEIVTAGSVVSTLVNSAVTFVSGASLTVWTMGRYCSIYYNNLLIGSMSENMPISQISSTHGLYTTDTGNTFNDLLIYDATGSAPFNTTAGAGDHVLLAVGDSKTANGSWPSRLITALEPEMSPRIIAETAYRYAVSGYTTAQIATYLTSYINSSANVGTPTIVTYNCGANDVVAMPDEATWKADTITSINAILSKAPGAQIYMARTWRRDYDAECDTLAGWIADVVALYPNNCHLGPDERIYLEGGDNGVTMTFDGIHPKTDATTQNLVAAAWMTAMGY